MRSSPVLALFLVGGLSAQADPNVVWHQRAGGGVHADGIGYTAAFDADGCRFHNRNGHDGALPTLGVRLVGARRGGRRIAVDARVEPVRLANRIRFDHGEVVANYLVGDRTVEQSFTLAARPGGVGDLVLEIEVSGNVHGAPVAAAHGPLTFRCAGAEAIRYGEAVAFPRGRSTEVAVLTRYDGRSRLELIVPAAFVDTASYPIVVDPVIGSAFAPGGVGNVDGTPAVAWSPDSERWCVVWQRRLTSSTQAILARLYDTDATPIGAAITIASGNEVYWPDVALCNRFPGDAFLIVWSGQRRIHGRLLRSTGSLLAPAFPISSPSTGEWDKAPSVSGPGDGLMMVAWPRAPMGVFDPRSVMLCDLLFLDPAQPALVSVGPEQTVETVMSGNVLGVRLADGDITRQVGAVDWFANRLVWSRFYTAPAPGDHDVRTASFRIRRSPHTFEVIDPPSDIPGSANIGPNERTPDIAMRAVEHGDETDLQYLIAWNDEGDVLGHMMDLDGTVGTGITIRDGVGTRREPRIGAGFCEFTVAYFDEVASNDTALRAARVLLDGTVAANDVLVEAPGTQLYQATLSSRPVPGAGINLRNRTLLAWAKPTFGNPGAFHVSAQFFEPVRPYMQPYGSPCPGPGGELPAIYMSSASDGPFPGNVDFRVAVTDAPPLSLAALVISDQFTTTVVPGAPGCELYAGLPWLTVLLTATLPSGGGVVDLPLPCGIPSGTALAFQWILYAPAANAFGWISSDDLDVSWSQF